MVMVRTAEGLIVKVAAVSSLFVATFVLSRSIIVVPDSEALVVTLKIPVGKPGVKVVIVGNKSEHELGEFVRANLEGAANLCGQTSLRQTFGLVWAAQGVVCNSSMILHTAAAFNKPTLALLGASFPSARKHKSLWGYGDMDLHLGREPERERIYTADEVMHLIGAHLQLGSLREPALTC